MIKILFFGDIVGRAGRQALVDNLPAIKKKYTPSLIIANGENAARGMGITGKICQDFYSLGIDCITTGNHVWDNKDIFKYINNDPRLLRPDNYSRKLPGKGSTILETPCGKKILIVNLMGQLFMNPQLNSPFDNMEKILESYTLGKNVQAIFVDFHAETTSEKQGFANCFDGKISAMLGTHTHTPTADERILINGTAMQTDVGMCGDYQSIIGMHKDVPIERFLKKYSTNRLEPADGPGTVCGTYIEIDYLSGLSKKIERFTYGEAF